MTSLTCLVKEKETNNKLLLHPFWQAYEIKKCKGRTGRIQMKIWHQNQKMIGIL